jgi:hypothetical protein
MIIGVHHNDQLAVIAADLSDRNTLIRRDLEDARAEDALLVEAMLYDETIGELLLTPGPIARDDRQDPLSPPETSWSLSIEEATAGEWIEQPTPTADLLSYKPERLKDTRCPRLDTAAKIALGVHGDHGFTRALGPSSALIGLVGTNGPGGNGVGATIFHIKDGVAHELIDRPAGLPIGAMFIDTDRTAYFGGANGEIWRGEIVETATTVRFEVEYYAAASNQGTIRFLDGGASPDGHELFVLTNQGYFARYVRGAWEEIHRFTLNPELSPKGGMIRLGPKHALAATSSGPQIIRFIDGTIHDDRPASINSGVTHVGPYQDGALVGAGTVFYTSPQIAEWDVLGLSMIQIDVYSSLEIPDGLLYGGALGYLAERKNNGVFCREELVGSGSVRALVPHLDGYLLGEDRPPSDDQTAATIVRRVYE